MSLTESINPSRSFDPSLEAKRIQEATESGASYEATKRWLTMQMAALFVEHGPVFSYDKSIPQRPYEMVLVDNGNSLELYVRDGKGELRDFGDQRQSYLKAEEKYIPVQLGLQEAYDILSVSQPGEAVMWISPREYYQVPRLPTEKPSTYDVVTFWVVRSHWSGKNSQGEISNYSHIECQTINIHGGLTSQQRLEILNFHSPSSIISNNPNAEETVTHPISFVLGDCPLGDHYAILNRWSNENPSFHFGVVGNINHYIMKCIHDLVDTNIDQMIHLLKINQYAYLNNLIKNLVHEIKAIDATYKGLDPEYEWREYLINQLPFMAHPLSFDSEVSYYDPFSKSWLHTEKNYLQKSCEKCGRKLNAEKKCSHCQKKE